MKKENSTSRAYEVKNVVRGNSEQERRKAVEGKVLKLICKELNRSGLEYEFSY